MKERKTYTFYASLIPGALILALVFFGIDSPYYSQDPQTEEVATQLVDEWQEHRLNTGQADDSTTSTPQTPQIDLIRQIIYYRLDLPVSTPDKVVLSQIINTWQKFETQKESESDDEITQRDTSDEPSETTNKRRDVRELRPGGDPAAVDDDGPEPDTTPPTVSTSTLTAGSVSTSSAIVSFSKATDDSDAQSSLVYELYSSSANDIDTVANVSANGSLEDSGTDVTSLTASGLNADSTYYLNVLVKDTSGNSSVYDSVQIQTDAPDPQIDMSHSMAQDLRMYLNFHEGSGGSIEDITGNGHNATTTGGQWTTIAGDSVWQKRTGEDDYMTVASHGDINFTTGPFSVGLVISYDASNGNWNELVDKGWDPGYGIHFPGWTDTLRLLVGDVQTDFTSVGVMGDLANLHTVVMVADQTNTVELYIDGSLFATSSLAAQVDPASAVQDLIMPNDTGNLDFEAYYNRVGIWGRDLSAQEVSDWHNDKDIMLE